MSKYVNEISPAFAESYRKKTPPWGPVGYITYKRTYARKVDGENRTEEWWETIRRCCNGIIAIGGKFTDSEIKDLYDKVFNLKCCFSGRALWQLGTDTVSRLGADSLQNCWSLAVTDPIEAFCFTFDELMLGGGVGFNIQREFVYEMPKVKYDVQISRRDEKDVDFIVPDNREGWVDLLRRTLQAFYYTGKSFTYSTICVRGKGAPIRSFGGTASGPEDLCDGIENIARILRSRVGKKLRPIDCLDIMNIIGSVVVAGNVRRCIPKGALIHCRHGMIPIEEVSIGTEVLTSDGYEKVSNVFAQGVQEVLRIRTQDGYFECTPNHRMAVMTAFNEYVWRMAKDLVPGDRLISPRAAIEGTKQEMPGWSYDPPAHSTTCKDIVVPTLDAEMAWFIGVFHADGYTYANREKNGCNAYVSIALHEDEYSLVEKAVKQLKRFGLNNIDIKHPDDEACWKIRVQSKQLAWYLDEFVKQPKQPIRVPEWIFCAPYDVRVSYLAGVADGDGSTGGRPVMMVSTVYKEFAEDIQRLAYSCGIESRLAESSEEWESRQGWQKQYFVNLITIHAKVALATCPHKMNDIKIGSKSQNANNYPSEWFSQYRSRLHASQNDFVNIDRLEVVLGKVPFVPVEVIEIASNGTRETFDIEVSNKHEFFCNGYLTHNSAQIALGDMDDRQYLDAKNWSKGNIPNWRAMSNNSVVCNDIEHLPPKFWSGYNGDGEPYGLINMRNCQAYGRLADGRGYRPDKDVTGVNPCAEICLASYESCNLAEIYLPNIKDEAEFKRVAELLCKVTKTISCVPFIHDRTNEIVSKNHRLGIGVTGFLQAPHLRDEKIFDNVYRHVEETDKKYSKALGVGTSIKLSTVKPSGTLSLLPGVTPGVHPAYSKFYIRRIRMASSDPLVDICREHGYHVEPVRQFDGSNDHNTMVVSFPIKTPDTAILAQEVSAVEQIEWQNWLQTHWADNSVSVTVYYRQEELPEVQAWLKENYNSKVKTISFLLHSGHGFAQAPMEEISQEVYEAMSAKTRPISDLHDDDSRSFADSLECAGGSCPVK